MTQYTYQNINQALPALCGEVLASQPKDSRNGPTRELRFPHIVLTDPRCRYVIAPGRHASVVAQIVETAWVLSGRNDIEALLPYLPRAKDFSDDGTTWRGGYGPRIRHADEAGDQLAHVVQLLCTEPLTRRAFISIYDPTVDMAPGKDIPCNDALHFLARKVAGGGYALDLHVFTRSNDLMWGWSGINAFEWSVLLEVVASMTDMYVGELHFSISSLHLYQPYFAKAERIASSLATRDAMLSAVDRPGHSTRVENIRQLDEALAAFWEAERQVRNNLSTAQDAVEAIPDPLLRHWGRVLRAWWDPSLTRPRGYGAWEALRETPACKTPHLAMLPPTPQPAPVDEERQQYLNFVTELDLLHQQKDTAYGDSWIKRGVTFGALPNICRKVDRLASGGTTDDETQLDTAQDLLLYVAKLYVYLESNVGNGPEHCNLVRARLKGAHVDAGLLSLSESLQLRAVEGFTEDVLQHQEMYPGGLATDDNALRLLFQNALALAWRRWVAAQPTATITTEDDYRGADAE